MTTSPTSLVYLLNEDSNIILLPNDEFKQNYHMEKKLSKSELVDFNREKIRDVLGAIGYHYSQQFTGASKIWDLIQSSPQKVYLPVAFEEKFELDNEEQLERYSPYKIYISDIEDYQKNLVEFFHDQKMLNTRVQKLLRHINSKPEHMDLVWQDLKRYKIKTVEQIEKLLTLPYSSAEELNYWQNTLEKNPEYFTSLRQPLPPSKFFNSFAKIVYFEELKPQKSCFIVLNYSEENQEFSILSTHEKEDNQKIFTLEYNLDSCIGIFSNEEDAKNELLKSYKNLAIGGIIAEYNEGILNQIKYIDDPFVDKKLFNTHFEKARIDYILENKIQSPKEIKKFKL